MRPVRLRKKEPEALGRVRSRINKNIDRRRNLVERFVNRLKHYRRIATRYEKTARNFLGISQLAAALEWLK